LLAVLCAAPALAQNAATSVSVDANANRHAINPGIYGVSYGATADIAALNAPLNRAGGNATSMYNWQINGHNAGSDWYFETYLDDGGATPGATIDNFITSTRAGNPSAEPLVTIPMIGYIANLGANNSTLESFSVKKYGAQQATDPYNSDAGNGVLLNGQDVKNDPSDASVANSTAIQQAWVQHLVTKWGGSAATNGVKYYLLDNEPSIWNSTHRDVHPAPATYEEMYNDIVAYASAIRAADPTAKIAGFEEWSWWAMYFSGYDQTNGTGSNSDYATHSNTYYYPWLLQQLYQYQQTHGTRLLDILTVHCYNDGPGSDDSLATQLARNKQTRILWDPTFSDPYWFGDIGINGRVVNWIPTLLSWVNQYYPGLPIGCTEYNWGDEPNLNGATTQADVLGIYGREGLSLATRWTVAEDTTTTPPTIYVTYLASQIYRNYDGHDSTFGDTSVAATVANPDNLSAFAAVRSTDGALTVMVINKQQGSTPVTVSLANFSTTGTAQAWQISSASQTSINHLADVQVAGNAISTTVPSQSITLFVIPAGSVTSPPSAPTGLAATVGDGTVTLTWNAGGGATSYTVKRGTKTGGPYSTVGTVTSPAPNSFADSGLTDGTTYYYVVSATNTAGTSANSSELAATPIVPPTFTSSASASPNPVTQGTSTTITATVTCTANTLTGGIVQVMAVDPSGNTAASQNFTAQSFTKNQSHTYTLSFTPSASGTFQIEVGVFSATWQSWNWNASAGTITVNSSLSFSSSATATPSSLAPGSSTAIAITVKDTGTSGLTNSIVELQAFDQSGNAAATTYWTGQNFTAGQTQQYSYTWAVPSSQATGTYTVEIGVFDSTWSTDYYWNSNAATITIGTQVSKPSAPTGLTATAGNAQVTLNWAAASGASSYNVYRGGAANGEGSQPIATGITATSFVNTGLTNGTPYFYKVAAVNTAGTSGMSSEASATPQVPKPSAPTGLTATAGNAQITLNWSAASGASSYNVYRGGAAGSEGSSPIATGITATLFVNTGLTNGTPYFYKVAAVNAGGTSGMSNEASATPQAPPQAPTGLTATAGNAQITLNWSASSGASSYNIYRGGAAGGEGSQPIATGITTTSFVNSGLTNGSSYFYKVAAANTAGTSGMSNEASATPQAPKPSAPTGLTATAGNAQVTLKWSASSGASSYNVYRGGAAGAENSQPVASGITATSFVDTGLANGTPYFYEVAAVNAAGASGMSNEASATPQAPPSGPVNVTSSVSIHTTAFKHNVRANLYTATMTITNKSTKAIAGPLEVVLTQLPVGVTLFNLSGAENGSPYITVPGVHSLAAGHAAAVLLEFKGPATTRIAFVPAVYSGSF
jgi:fibronectin type 3 domain-containing protein